MTNREITERTASYRLALIDGRITGKEYYGFIEALAQLASK